MVDQVLAEQSNEIDLTVPDLIMMMMVMIIVLTNSKMGENLQNVLVMVVKDDNKACVGEEYAEQHM